MRRSPNHRSLEERPKSAGKPQIPRIIALFRPYRLQVAVIAATILITSGLGVVNPLLIKLVFDRALFPRGGPNLHVLAILVGLMIAMPVVLSAIGVAQTYLTNRVGQQVMQNLRDALYAHLQEMSLRFFTETRTGEIQSRLANDVGGIQSIVTDTASSILSNIVTVISSLAAMLVLSWQLTVLSLCLLPLFLVLRNRVGRKRRALAMEAQQSKAELSAITEETLSVSGVLLAKVFNRQQDEVARYARESRRQADLQVRQQMVGRVFFASIGTFFSITPALVYLVAGYAILHGYGAGITAGTLVAFTTLQSRIFYPVGSLLQVSVDVEASLALFQRVFEYLDLPVDLSDARTARTIAPAEVRGAVRFRDVSFRYDRSRHPEHAAGSEPSAVRNPAPDTRSASGGTPDTTLTTPAPRRWAIERLSLEIKPGQLAALVGPSGAGKTTISYLVPRLYDVSDGGIEIDGTDVREIRQASLAEGIGIVTQESYLFHASVRENLLYAKPLASQGELEGAARAALIHERIMEMPEGYETIVGERGYRLSGGEKQRVAIARVVLKDPRILILDEATSALDTTSERLVQAALKPLMAGRTTIAIAHRLSTILAAGVIFVLDRGRLVEQGTHAELLRRGGLYAQLYQQQFESGLVEARCQDGFVLSSGQILAGVAAD
jgi:ATP-binding cassette subfamily B protein